MARTKKDEKEKKVKKVKKDTKRKKEELNLNEVKEELTIYIDKEIKKGIDDRLEKSYKKIIRQKNRKLFFKNIIILLLTALVLYLVYLLNTVNYFDNILKIGRKNNIETNEVETNVTNKTFSELKSEYSKLLDNIYINENSSYLKDYYNNNLTNELKSYLSLNLVDFKSLEKEDNYNIVDLSVLKESYSKIFEDSLDSVSFDYNGNKINYLNKLTSYITTSTLDRDNTNIKREIIDIKEEDNNVIITTIEGLVKDNKIFNILTNKEVGSGNDLVKYKDKLNTVNYTFKNSKLISL